MATVPISVEATSLGDGARSVAAAEPVGTGPATMSAEAAGGNTSPLGIWLNLLCLMLLGYALLGKGLAYVGYPPFFIGELVLFCGLITFLLFGKWRGVLENPVTWSVLVLGGWGLLRILPDVGRYGADTLRDAAIWGYSLFALIVAGLVLAQPSRLRGLLQKYRTFCSVFVLCIPFTWLASRFLAESIPHWPWADVAVVAPKSGDIMVHMSGVLAFWTLGLGGRIGNVRLLMLAGCVVIIATIERSGLLAFLAVFAVLALDGLVRMFVTLPEREGGRDKETRRQGDKETRRQGDDMSDGVEAGSSPARYPPLTIQHSVLWRLVAWGICGVVVLALSGVRVNFPGKERDISFDQLLANAASFTGSAKVGDLDETKAWRLDWWNEIMGYTVHGKYFWSGKGFGINLADDDDFQVEEESALRSPHNGHLTMLARGGIPGIGLWTLAQLSWACAVGIAYLRSLAAGHWRWTQFFLFLLAYWLAFMVNAAFDVFLEGPMGGIWFWCLYGVGLAALWLYKHNPAVLDDAALAVEVGP